jgi:hypothetical protein
VAGLSGHARLVRSTWNLVGGSRRCLPGARTAVDEGETRAQSGDVIPTVLLVGLLFGRWWKITVSVAIVGWPALLILTHVDSGFAFAVAAGLLAAANVVAGVLAYQVVRLVVRRAAAFARHAAPTTTPD